MAKTIYLYFSCLKAKVNFGLFNIDIAFVCAKSCHLWSDRADHALYKICIHRRLSSGLSHFLAQARDCFARGVRTCRQSVWIGGILQSSMSSRVERDIASWALEKFNLNKREIPKKKQRIWSPKNLIKERSRNKKGFRWPMSKQPSRVSTQGETDDKESGELFFLKSRDRPIMIWRNNKCINTGWLHPPPLSHRSLDAKEQWQCSHHHQDTWCRRYPAKV